MLKMKIVPKLKIKETWMLKTNFDVEKEPQF